MTIDEVSKAFSDIAFAIDTKPIAIINDEQRHKIVRQLYDVGEWLEELKWYREHDLIDRAKIPTYCHMSCLPKGGKDCNKCGELVSFNNEIRLLPKAEPTSSKMEQVAKNATTTNGDCETCKHYKTEYCAWNDLTTVCEDYEPYIPNPIEKEFIVHNKEDWDRFIADIDKE